MALPDTLLARLIETVKAHDLGGRFLMLGRQRWIGSRRGPSARLFREVIDAHLNGVAEDELKNPDDIYCETFFQRLGFVQVDSLDFSEFEGASIVQDLSAPLPEALIGAFDVIYDGGTCEHVFDLPTAYRNIHTMLKPGGVLIGHSPCNNWINHGFYQITPEMVYGFWQRSLGYGVLEVTLQPLHPKFARNTATTTNPNETGRRPRIQGDHIKNLPLILNYAVSKPLAHDAPADGVYQTDYLPRWAGSDADGP